MNKPLGITELVLRDGHQSLFATRMRIDDMLPIAQKLDEIGYWSIETWGGATFDSCIRYLGEDPWERLRKLKQAMPRTKQQMLFRAQNILGYRHYADDVVTAFVERAAENGMDVFRIFDAMNDMRNLRTAVAAVVKSGKHAQGTLSYTVSPVHTIEMWLDMAKQLQDLGVDSICIKDMAGLLKPFVAEELVTRLKEAIEVPLALHSHATTGMSTATITKAAEAGIDSVDASISSMSMTYGHSATESVVAIFADHPRTTGLDLGKLEEIAAYFRKVRKKYGKFEGSLKGVDSRILVSQVPGGMLTNMENQLKEQGAEDQLDAVLSEIPKVRKDLGYIPLVTPTSQIVGTQAVVNVLTGERYKSISKETAGVLKGEYGATAAPVNPELQQRVLAGGQPVTDRPADHIPSELMKLSLELEQLAKDTHFELAENPLEDTLIYALFPQIGIKFLQHRGDPSAFEPAPSIEVPVAPAAPAKVNAEVNNEVTTTNHATMRSEYYVTVEGRHFEVSVSAKGSIERIKRQDAASMGPGAAETMGGMAIKAPLAGNIFEIKVKSGDRVKKDEVVVVLEAMKMETEIRAHTEGVVTEIRVSVGDAVAVGEVILALGH